MVLAAVGVAAVLGLGLLSGEGGEEASLEPEGVSTAPTTVATILVPSTTTTMQTTTTVAPGDDPLCVAAEELAESLDGHLPVQSPEDLETVSTAQVTFYEEALNHVAGAELGAFEEVLVYQQQGYEWSEANNWEPERSFEDLADNPPPTPPAAALSVVIALLEDRCGIVAPSDQAAG